MSMSSYVDSDADALARNPTQHFQKPLQPEGIKSIACGNLRPRLLRLDPALGTRVEEIEGQHTAVQHLVMESPYVEP